MLDVRLPSTSLPGTAVNRPPETPIGGTGKEALFPHILDAERSRMLSCLNGDLLHRTNRRQTPSTLGSTALPRSWSRPRGPVLTRRRLPDLLRSEFRRRPLLGGWVNRPAEWLRHRLYTGSTGSWKGVWLARRRADGRVPALRATQHARAP